ncbi:MAG: heparinase II/III family protein [Sedimentisphaerales bacterium]|nr:heparinase II/III family protein [Sedimentisphaerales bacterium]
MISQTKRKPAEHLALTLLAVMISIACLCVTASAAETSAHPVPKDHPRLLGSRTRLQSLAADRPDMYKRVVNVARRQQADDHAKIISIALVCAIEQDLDLGRDAVKIATKYINGPIKKGHVTFGSDLALCAIAYDLCYDSWTPQQRSGFHDYMNKTVDANVKSETHVFHNAWYGYKNWGIGLACYAAYYENPRAPEILDTLEQDWLTRAAPALQLAGAGGAWAEGYYINYFLYEWLFFCEAARYCSGKDYYPEAPAFFENRAIASMFETYPGIGIYNSRRSVPMGDGGGRTFGGDRDKTLSARRILVNRFRTDPAHHAVHAFNETTPRSSVGVYAYKDFLWRDTTVQKADLDAFKLSHFSPGPGHIYARSSWKEDATYFFFKASDRFTAHQHLDVGHFVIYKNAELIGDAGHYDAFGSAHDVNYHLRTIAHNTILVRDPAEKWPAIRVGNVTANDAGQHHNWPHHNGAVADPQSWIKDKTLYDIADITAFEDKGPYLYLAADCTGAYSPQKLEYFTRQIVFIRPDTFVIFDRVRATRPEFKKTFLLQAMEIPARREDSLVVTNGTGRLFIQTILPAERDIRLVSGPDLYKIDAIDYPPSRDTGPAPKCRIEISPKVSANTDYFLNVLTASDTTADSARPARMEQDSSKVTLIAGQYSITFDKSSPAFSIDTP